MICARCNHRRRGKRQRRAWKRAEVEPGTKAPVRLFNVLKRWCSALADPRFFWISVEAGVRNYIALLTAVTDSWTQSYLPEDRLRVLLETLFQGFIRGDRKRGYLWLLNEEERGEAIAAIPSEAKELAAGLVFAVFNDRDTAHPFIFEWQPFLVPALDLEIIAPGVATPALVARLVHQECSPSAVELRLLEVAEYTDDPHWCERMERALNFANVAIRTGSFKGARLVVDIGADTDLLKDHRMPRLVREALDYRHSEPALIVESGQNRLRVERDGKAGVWVNGQARTLTNSLSREQLRRLDAAARPFADLLSEAESKAA